MIDLRFAWRARKFRSKWNRAEIRAMQALLHPGGCAIDVGSHKGGWLYWMRRSVGRTGRVCAIEPQPELAAYLAEVVARNGWRNVAIHRLGLGADEGMAILHVPGPDGHTSPAASLIAAVAEAEASRDHVRHDIPTRVTSLDALVRAQNLPQVDFLKIDVEGAELEVLQGAGHLLESQTPAVLLECERRHLRLQNKTMDAVFAELLTRGYQGSFFDRWGSHPLAEFDPEVHQAEVGPRFWDRPTYANNFLFVKPAPGRA